MESYWRKIRTVEGSDYKLKLQTSYLYQNSNLTSIAQSDNNSIKKIGYALALKADGRVVYVPYHSIASIEYCEALDEEAVSLDKR